jgi:soluble lytic murein transglycosylase-like protein
MFSRKRRVYTMAYASLLLVLSDKVIADDCFDRAARYQGVRVDVLRAIAMRENAHCDATISRNTNGSADIGCMQINTIHLNELRALGVFPQDLIDQCKNIYIGAWHYKRMVAKYGDNWIAVGAYNSETIKFRNKYAVEVYKIWMAKFRGR